VLKEYRETQKYEACENIERYTHIVKKLHANEK